jgi:hypothetical protein
MKVVCISDEVEGLTLGKVYFSQNHVKKEKNDLQDSIISIFSKSVIKTSKGYHRIINDNLMVSWYDASLFIPIDELRENKLNELGI